MCRIQSKNSDYRRVSIPYLILLHKNMVSWFLYSWFLILLRPTYSTDETSKRNLKNVTENDVKQNFFRICVIIIIQIQICRRTLDLIKLLN